jgi:ribosome biogenesis SPOUT family RNA methylase Rps3
MAVETRDNTLCGGDHVVQFYDHDDHLARSVGDYLASAVTAGEVAIVIATEVHRRAFEAELERAGIDVAAARREGTLLLLDAAATMARFMPDGQIDAGAFRAVIGGLIGDASRRGAEIRAYGEMVALLWERGEVVSAIELEKLWNELGRELCFAL